MAAEILEFFRLTEADGYIIMSAYGLHALDVDHFQENQKEANKVLADVQDRKLIGEPPAPLPIGGHPEFIRQSAGAKNAIRKESKRLLPRRPESSALTPSKCQVPMSKIHNQEPTGSYSDGHRQAPAVKYQPKAQRSYFDVGIGSIRLSGADTWGKYCLLELGLAPGMSSLPHTHTRGDEAYFVLSGELEVIVGEEVFLLRPGDTLIVPRNFPHQLRNSGKTENHYLIIFSPSGLENL